MVETIGIEPMQNTGLQPVALPTELSLHVYRHTILVVSFDHRKIAISMSYVRIRLYSSAVDAIAIMQRFNVCLQDTHFLVLGLTAVGFYKAMS